MEFVGNSYGRNGADGIARVIWELTGNAMNSGRPVPTTTRLYSLEFYGTADGGHNGWQPVESQFHGIVGEGGHGIPPWDDEPSPLYDEHIPWSGAFMSNHQFIGSTGKDDGAWHPIDNDTEGGPQAPFNANFNSPPDGMYMWLRAGSWLYAKWDFPFNFDRSWSALRLTQVSGPQIEGDYNEDGIVDALDYVVWRKTGIDGTEGYNAWRANFGVSVGGAEAAGTSAVPEPASAALLLTGTAAILWLATRRWEFAPARCVPVRSGTRRR
jgi:hypothetical protein